MKRQLGILFLVFTMIPNFLLAQINPVQLGRASNVLTILRPQQNQVTVNHESNSIAFIHQQDITIWGGGGTANGRLRYDLSTDGGNTFTNDIGVLQLTYTNYARFPQTIFYGTDANAFNNNLVWAAPTNHFPTPGWLGIVTGISNVTLSNPSSTEHYQFDPEPTHTLGGLCEGLPGEFWMTEMIFDGSNIGDSVQVYKGTYNSGTQDVDWALHIRRYVDYALSYDGSRHMEEPNMAFSPDGLTGWIALVGDIVGGSDSTYNPIFLKSIDGGATWSSPMEVDLRNVGYTSSGSLDAELKALWEDVNNNPISSGRPTCTYDFDVTVDANGNPHLFVVIGSASTAASPAPDYSVKSGLAKLAVDITTPDGGNTWSMHKVSPIYTFRGEFGTPDPNNGSLQQMDNYTQVSRSESGSHIFYSWVDSDTTTANGGVGFGVADNLAPNLRIAAKRVSDGYVSCPKWITSGDIFWDGMALFPTMAPEVLTDYSGFQAEYKLPIVFVQMIANNQLEPCSFHYLGNDATVLESDFWGEAAWINTDNCFVNPTVGIQESKMENIVLYPVPATDRLTISGLKLEKAYLIEVFNNVGQLILETQIDNVKKTDLNVSELIDGYYTVRMVSSNGLVVKPFIVTR